MATEVGPARQRKREAMEALGEQIAEHAAHLDAATHRLLCDIRVFDQEGGWADQGARTCAQWLSWRLGWGTGTAREHVRVANRLGELPLIDDALRRGELSYCKVRAITRVALPTNEATLLEYARYSTGAQLEAICRKYASVLRHDVDTRPQDDKQRRYVTRYETADGMVKIVAVLHPEEAALCWAALDRIATERCRDSRSASSAARTSVLAETPSTSVSHSTVTGPAEPTGSATSNVPAESSRAPAHSSDATIAESAATNPRVPAESSSNVSGASAAGSDAPIRARTVTHNITAFSRADALVLIAEEIVRGTRRERSPIELAVTVPHETLRAGHVPAGPRPGADASHLEARGSALDPTAVACFTDATCISAHAARRLSCDCGIVDVVEDDRGIALSIGRRRRSIPTATKAALLRRDKTCRFPGCQVRVFLQGHHLEHWADGGETSLDNLVCLCTHHHRYLHEYGYSVALTDDGDFAFQDPRGRPVLDAPPLPKPRGRGFDAIIERNASLGISAETPMCGWDGTPVDYRLAIDGLVAVDSR